MKSFRFRWKFRNKKLIIVPILASFDTLSRRTTIDIQLFTIGVSLSTNSLLRLTFDLPERPGQNVSFSGDLFFLRNTCIKFINSISDDILWNANSIPTYKLLIYFLLQKLFKRY